MQYFPPFLLLLFATNTTICPSSSSPDPPFPGAAHFCTGWRRIPLCAWKTLSPSQLPVLPPYFPSAERGRGEKGNRLSTPLIPLGLSLHDARARPPPKSGVRRAAAACGGSAAAAAKCKESRKEGERGGGALARKSPSERIEGGRGAPFSWGGREKRNPPAAR